jgi:hypothetical protein
VLAVHPTRKGQQGELLPAVLLQFVGSGKVIFHATDETYRWTAYPGDPKHYARYWLQTLRYLSRSKLSSSQASVDVSVDRSQYHHGETVRLRVQFGDERSAPSEDHGVVVVVQHGGGRRHQVILHRDGTRRGVFAGNITGLPVGSYRAWLASQGAQGASCSFTVAAPPGELARVAMDSKDLMQAAKTSGGRFYAGDKAQRLLHDLPPGQRTTIESLPQQPIWNSSFIVGLFVLLITAEWLMRKRRGMI